MRPVKPDLGIYYEMFDAIATGSPALSLLAKPWSDVEEWRSRARAKVFELLAFDPIEVPLKPSIEARQEENNLVVEEISYEMPYGPRSHGFFMYPKKHDIPIPAVVALHDHGEFFYFGKEKITDVPNEPAVLREHKARHYGGRGWATALARQGFAVLAVDTFLWGSRRIPIDTMNEELQKPFEGLDLSSDDYIRKFNVFWATNECILVVDTILNAGANWPGILAYEDRRSVDYLLTRPEVDPNRIACGGLSMGGLRTILLAGLDPRISCAFCVGFMSTIRSLLRNHIRCPPGHGLLMYAPNLFSYLDLPDIIALRAPSPLMVQYNREDELFTAEGQDDAHQKIAAIYSKLGSAENYVGKFYPGPHKFDVEMQEEAFRWLKGCLSKD